MKKKNEILKFFNTRNEMWSKNNNLESLKFVFVLLFLRYLYICVYVHTLYYHVPWLT